MSRKITLEEKKSIYLDMLREVDAFCRLNNIRYSLSSGTLIGAIRHGGFIPWDDDLDITMPLPDLLRFRQIFKSDNIAYWDIETDSNYELSFPRLVQKKTFAKRGFFNECMGVAVDLYVVVGLPDNEQEYFRNAIRSNQLRRRLIIPNHVLSRLTPFDHVPGFSYLNRKYWNSLYDFVGDYNHAKRFFRIANSVREGIVRRNTLDFDFFDGLDDIYFEGLKCLATVHYNEYLTQRYGDYMQLPPVEQRHPRHLADFYWR